MAQVSSSAAPFSKLRSGGSQHRHFLHHPAIPDHRDDPVADRPSGHAVAFADAIDNARDFTARRERTLRLG